MYVCAHCDAYELVCVAAIPVLRWYSIDSRHQAELVVACVTTFILPSSFVTQHHCFVLTIFVLRVTHTAMRTQIDGVLLDLRKVGTRLR